MKIIPRRIVSRVSLRLDLWFVAFSIKNILSNSRQLSQVDNRVYVNIGLDSDSWISDFFVLKSCHDSTSIAFRKGFCFWNTSSSSTCFESRTTNFRTVYISLRLIMQRGIEFLISSNHENSISSTFDHQLSIKMNRELSFVWGRWNENGSWFEKQDDLFKFKGIQKSLRENQNQNRIMFECRRAYVL